MTTRGQTGVDKTPPGPTKSGEAAEWLPAGVLSPGANEQAESPGQTEALMEQVADPANLNAAWKRVRENGGAPGIDGIAVDAFVAHAKPRAESLRRELLEGSYRPSPLRRVTIPKPSGGQRKLSIPTVQDRVVQQAILQVLQPILDPTFSEHSYGFRPGRSAHQAVAAAQEYIQEGYSWVVDFDLEAFFDRVSHDRLMSRLGQRIADRRLCWIIRRFLQAGVLEEGIVKPTNEGAPQGGPLSPILSNLVLDELDKELERRGLRFVRYADDQNVFVRSEQAAQRAFENLTEFIEGRLKLKVNRAKSAVARPWQRKLLGFSFTEGKTTKRTIAPKALAKARERIRKLTARGHCNFQAMMAGLRQYLVGWLGYFRFCQTPRVLAVLEAWTHRRLRALIWRQWKCGRTRFAELVKRGVRLESAAIAAGVSRGPWRQSRNPLLLWIFSKAWFIEHGLPSFNARA
jgi:RNA-directed DNA polymerase